MTRPLRAAITAIALLATAGCVATPSEVVVSGNVENTLTTVAAPRLGVPAVNLDAGFSDLTGTYNPVTGRTANASSAAASSLSLGSMVGVASVAVAQGDTVKAGQLVGTIDTRAQKAQLAAAIADADVAAAQVGLLADAIDTTFDKEADVRDARAKVVDAIGKVRTGIATVKKKMAQGRTQLAAAKRALAQIDAQIAALPPGVPVPAALQQAHDKLVAGIKAGTAGLKQARAILRKLTTGLTKARAGLRKINDGLAGIADARGNLRDLKELATIQAKALEVPIDVVRTQLTLGRLTAPVDGVVVSVAAAGDVLAPGATVVTIRETGPSKLTAWLSPTQLDQVCPGDSGGVAGDWMGDAVVPATLTSIGTRADYPPTSVATDEVHLTRAVQVEFTATEQLPAGVPVEISIQGCHAAADANDSNR